MVLPDFRSRFIISIHAAQEGCDCFGTVTREDGRHFNPRSPRGLRRVITGAAAGSSQFQSTQPKRAATGRRSKRKCCKETISIHAAQEGCDTSRPGLSGAGKISIHAAQEGCDDVIVDECHELNIISIHAAQEGCDLWA